MFGTINKTNQNGIATRERKEHKEKVSLRSLRSFAAKIMMVRTSSSWVSSKRLTQKNDVGTKDKMTANKTQKQPLALTVICVLIIVVALFAVIRNIMTVVLAAFVPQMADALKSTSYRWGISAGVVLAYSTAVRALFILAAVAMLKRLNWGRVLTFILIPQSFVVYMLLTDLAPEFAFRVVVACIYIGFLLSPSVKHYFNEDIETLKKQDDAPTTTPTVP